MAGRKPKPDHLKLITGTAQACRMNPSAPEGSKAPPVAPDWLSERAAEIFEGLVEILGEMGLASGSDTAMLAMLASRIEEVEICTAVIEDAGRVYVSKAETTTGEDGTLVVKQMVRARPEVSMRNEALRHVQSLLAEFGLSPAARSRVSAAGKKEEDEFADF
ncbi:phage terminase small subunit P27 family [Enterovirga rhinocerotis]|uniref:P27 family predicted phage terminase small subunit n=1 Tax=Enterovirga rhinocerotis TaxID=1339210 RepID=A0A4R7C6I9_9HYPH|nr:phage terminase small subunit P27 family [Enterovirga rhinocerotis]TDR94194.1 P27 family predicted phage terminase small subunit [Enterovirga rhinocerotis]